MENSILQPKKRGRKPKLKTEMNTTIETYNISKRGRKPKDKIIIPIRNINIKILHTGIVIIYYFF